VRGFPFFYPSFDVTDHQLITGIVTERGIIKPPFVSNIKKIIGA
jgi:methylthioribose-1-phosphate isomerase